GWQARAAATPDLYLHALVNEGADAGSSLPHTHSQLVWFSETPPEVERELALAADRCAICERAGDDGLLVAERGGVEVRAAWAARLPYELLVSPLEHETDPWRSDRLATALQLVAESLRRLHDVEGPRPVNAWLHARGHWHIEV